MPSLYMYSGYLWRHTTSAGVREERGHCAACAAVLVQWSVQY